MRKLWEDHVTWTRLAIISLTTGSPDTEATVGRLLQNQDDIGDAIAPFYGEEAGNQLATLLREHITIAADLIAAAKAGNQPEVARQQARWEANADEIARFLNSANTRWKLDETRSMLLEHLQLTTSEVVRPAPERLGLPTSPPTTRSTARRSTWRTCSRPGSWRSSRSGSAKGR